jgi:protein phosphatase 1G
VSAEGRDCIIDAPVLSCIPPPCVWRHSSWMWFARHGVVLREGFDAIEEGSDDSEEGASSDGAKELKESPPTEPATEGEVDAKAAGQGDKLKKAIKAAEATEAEEAEEAEEEEEEEEEEEDLHNEETQEAYESGSTSVTCFIYGSPLQVTTGWAGDSRAVLCRGGKAVDLSDDHKPEDKIELARIHAAGSIVNEDGRVDGNLNLSRALGDFMHKQNKEISAEAQAITAFPDTRSVVLEDTDEFIVVACDGIWNSMESQECVDFIRERISKASKISEVCTALLDACMEPDPDREGHDGNGMDNETAIIIKLNGARKPEERPAKKRKGD